MAAWTVFGIAVECGTAHGPHQVPAGDPVLVVSGGIRRCELHASIEVDWAAVDAARHRIEAERAAGSREATPATPPVRMRPVRPVSAFRQLGDLFDPKALAAGDGDR